MTPTPLAVPETDRIAALLAAVMPQAVPSVAAPPSAPPDDVTQNVRAFRAQLPPPEPDVPLGRLPVRELLGQANWRNQSPDAPLEEAPAVPASLDPGPLSAPFGVLAVSALFDLVNWRNRPDEAKPLPVIAPPPRAGLEFTVEAMLPTFGWE